MVHEYLQTEFTALFPNKTITVEAKTDLASIGLDGSATVDIVIEPDSDDQRTIVVEVKTINGFGFKKAATSFKGPPTGPRWGAIVQGALSAAARNADLIIVYVSLENLSPAMALSYGDGTTLGQFAAEWHIDASTAADIAAAEVARINHVLTMADADILPPRTIHDPELPAGATVVDPARKTWHVRNATSLLGTGTTWMCDYCDYRSKCIEDGEGGAPTTEEF
jgi:ethanolamine utilization protein EutP (predicted NTPase)